MKGMDLLFFQKEEKVRIKQQSGDLFRAVRKELHKNTSKYPKLQQTLEEAMDCDKYREYGDLCLPTWEVSSAGKPSHSPL